MPKYRTHCPQCIYKGSHLCSSCQWDKVNEMPARFLRSHKVFPGQSPGGRLPVNVSTGGFPKRIVLIGEMGSGKDTIAEILKDYERIAFGDLIRDIAKWIRKGYTGAAKGALIGLFRGNSPDDLSRRLKDFATIPQDGPKDRLLLQELGTYCRLHCDTIWSAPILGNLKEDQNYIITDCRRQAEFNACKAAGFTPVAVVAFESVRLERLKSRDGNFDPSSMQHTAEREVQALIPQCDAFVYNNGTVEDLKIEVSQIKVKKVMCNDSDL